MEICADLWNQNIQLAPIHYRRLTDLKLADTSKNLKKIIEIFIGNDYYYSCFGESFKRVC